jgi:hypothetical protein
MKIMRRKDWVQGIRDFAAAKGISAARPASGEG